MHDGGGHDSIGIANKNAASLAVALKSKLHPIFYGHEHDAADQRNPLGRYFTNVKLFGRQDRLHICRGLLGSFNEHLFDELTRQPAVIDISVRYFDVLSEDPGIING